jgi:replication factor A1
VSEISPFNCNSLTLKLKVDNKTAVRTYTNQKGEGKMFSLDLVDETGEIKCTVFNEMVDTYEPIFQVGKVYRINRAGIKPANPKFCR